MVCNLAFHGISFLSCHFTHDDRAVLVGCGLRTSVNFRGLICRHSRPHLSGSIVSKGRMIVKKRDSTLDFTTKVIIVVCTLVKVYNMKKKTGLIVTVVSITSLYF